mmetsp:Transcript_143285/g.445376  ORF Transcript_143285/g.445376 Transcript_143285/m.445376 type:complete len:279 (+) Transcript_143285:613-1449(+)
MQRYSGDRLRCTITSLTWSQGSLSGGPQSATGLRTAGVSAREVPVASASGSIFSNHPSTKRMGLSTTFSGERRRSCGVGSRSSSCRSASVGRLNLSSTVLRRCRRGWGPPPSQQQVAAAQPWWMRPAKPTSNPTSSSLCWVSVRGKPAAWPVRSCTMLSCRSRSSTSAKKPAWPESAMSFPKWSMAGRRRLCRWCAMAEASREWTCCACGSASCSILPKIVCMRATWSLTFSSRSADSRPTSFLAWPVARRRTVPHCLSISPRLCSLARRKPSSSVSS